MELENELLKVFFGKFVFVPKIPGLSVSEYVDFCGGDSLNLVIFVPSPDWRGTFYFLENLGFSFDLYSVKNVELERKYGVLIRVCADEKELQDCIKKLSSWKEKVQPWRPKRGD